MELVIATDYCAKVDQLWLTSSINKQHKLENKWDRIGQIPVAGHYARLLKFRGPQDSTLVEEFMLRFSSYCIFSVRLIYKVIYVFRGVRKIAKSDY